VDDLPRHRVRTTSGPATGRGQLLLGAVPDDDHCLVRIYSPHPGGSRRVAADLILLYGRDDHTTAAIAGGDALQLDRRGSLDDDALPRHHHPLVVFDHSSSQHGSVGWQ